jgi:hypothetical protein
MPSTKNNEVKRYHWRMGIMSVNIVEINEYAKMIRSAMFAEMNSDWREASKKLRLTQRTGKPPALCTPSQSCAGRTAGSWGLPSVHALGLGDARLKLARLICGNLKQFSLAWRARPGLSLYCCHVSLRHSAGKQSPRPTQRHAPRLHKRRGAGRKPLGGS